MEYLLKCGCPWNTCEGKEDIPGQHELKISDLDLEFEGWMEVKSAGWEDYIT
jgi:hypothetical protein